MSKKSNDTPQSEPEQLTDEQLKDVIGAGKFSGEGLQSSKLVGNDTLFGNDPDRITTTGIKGTDTLKR